jgi:hypothetical protein
MKSGYVVLNIKPLHSNYDGIVKKQGETIATFPVKHLDKLGFPERDIEEITTDWQINSHRHRDGCFEYTISAKSTREPTPEDLTRTVEVIQEVIECNKPVQRSESTLRFVNLHAHSGVGSPFDGFGYPQEHMDFAYEQWL